jgi:hypothetical protein
LDSKLQEWGVQVLTMYADVRRQVRNTVYLVGVHLRRVLGRDLSRSIINLLKEQRKELSWLASIESQLFKRRCIHCAETLEAVKSRMRRNRLKKRIVKP